MTLNNKPKKDVVPEDLKGTHLLPEGITFETLRENWETCKTQYTPIRERMILLDLVDSGKLWTKLCAKFPQYQISPDTNHVNYIKENVLASIYTVGKGANIVPRKKEDEETVNQINKVLDTIWDILSVPHYQQQAGERAALLNLGVTQVGWNEDLVGGTQGSWYKGDVVFKNIDPMNYFRDPFSNDLDDAAYVIYHEKHSKVNLMANSNYKERLKLLEQRKNYSSDDGDVAEYWRDTLDKSERSGKNPRLIIHWIKVSDDREGKERNASGYRLHEIHTLNNQIILHVKEDISINIFPFAELYCNEPGSDLVGQSEPDKILASSMVVNILDGVVATHAYKAQRPPRFLNVNSGINVRNFAKYGNDPDYTWLVQQNASEAVHYQEFPALPQEVHHQLERMETNIKSMSGIDERYTGKDTGSVQTTGGIEAMMAQSTMRDTTKINLYEAYSKRLSRLVLKHLIVHGDKRTYLAKDNMSKNFVPIELDFPKIDDSIEFSYAINISNQLPKNRMRLAQAADAMLEKSMQYQDPSGQTPDILTPEEWMTFQEFPQKDLILERMKLQRTGGKVEEFVQHMTMFTSLVAQGMSPEEAMEEVASVIEQGGIAGEGMTGSVGNESSAEMGGFAGSMQARQQG